jgi:hypothetical protein
MYTLFTLPSLLLTHHFCDFEHAGIDSIAADHKDQKMTVIGGMDTVCIAKKLKKFGRVDVLSVGPAKEEKKGGKN